MKKRVADIIIETLINNNITDAFCVVGGGAMFLNNAAGINPDMHIIFNHHEQACAMACEGYARTKDRSLAIVLCMRTLRDVLSVVSDTLERSWQHTEEWRMIRRSGAQDVTMVGNTEMIYVFSVGLQGMESSFSVPIVAGISWSMVQLLGSVQIVLRRDRREVIICRR